MGSGSGKMSVLHTNEFKQLNIKNRQRSGIFRTFHLKAEKVGQKIDQITTYRPRKIKQFSAIVISILILTSAIFVISTMTDVKVVSGQVSSVTVSGPSELSVGQTGQYSVVMLYGNSSLYL